MVWVVNNQRKIIVGLVAGALFVLLLFWAPLSVQRVVCAVLVAAAIVELNAQAVRHARQKAQWALVVLLALFIAAGTTGLLRLADAPQGAWYVFVVAVVVAATDVGAQCIGQYIGAPGTFFPTLSPNKSLHGVLGGFACGMVAAIISAIAMGGDARVWMVFLVLPVLAVVGDLVESATKRRLGIKDFGSYIPQTGGLLDRIDSWLLPLALVGWVCT